jgi:3-deoxy-manno-octulosonate cytidylyltransferase (CMP-KDO synthetase)
MPESPQLNPLGPCIIIPARFASTRFPGKPLVRLAGRGGLERSLIEWSWRAAQAVPGAGQVVVATDDRRIVDEVERFGGFAVMTPTECANGTERCAAAVGEMTPETDLIVNFQGDAPLTPPHIVAAVIKRMRADPGLSMATPAIPCHGETYAHLLADRSAGRVGGTTVVFNRSGHALYFSKNVIPYVPPDGPAPDAVHLHIGIYGYRRGALAEYRAAPPSALEALEGLEQLRFLDMGLQIGIVVCEPPDGPTIELNNPTDVVLVEDELQRRRL